MLEVVAALIWKGEKFMICRRSPYKTRGLLWEFASGKVEPGETKEQALIRGCREELAITVAGGGRRVYGRGTRILRYRREFYAV